jgi:hypothetical protein
METYSTCVLPLRDYVDYSHLVPARASCPHPLPNDLVDQFATALSSQSFQLIQVGHHRGYVTLLGPGTLVTCQPGLGHLLWMKRFSALSDMCSLE